MPTPPIEPVRPAKKVRRKSKPFIALDMSCIKKPRRPVPQPSLIKSFPVVSLPRPRRRPPMITDPPPKEAKNDKIIMNMYKAMSKGAEMN